jgi:hypothetical protein
MDKDAILKALLALNEGGGIVTTEIRDAVVQRRGDNYRMKTAFGYFSYSAEELANELSEWEEEILMIQ